MAIASDLVIKAGRGYAGWSPTLNLQKGGQFGYANKVGVLTNGKSYAEYLADHAQVETNIICRVLDYPRFFDYTDDPKMWIGCLVNLLEVKPESIDGLDSSLTVDFEEHAVGGAGEQFEEVSNVTRARSVPVFNYKELAGRAIGKFLNYWIRYGMMDPDTKVPLITNSKKFEGFDGIYLPSMKAATCLFIKPDILHRNAMDAWLVTNMMPKGDGERKGQRNITQAGTLTDLPIEFSGISLGGDVKAIMDLANSILRSTKTVRQIPDEFLQAPLDGIDPSVAAIKNTGFDLVRETK